MSGNRYHSVVADNVNKQLFSADVQLYPENKPFYLILGAERLMMTNAWVVNYDEDSHCQSVCHREQLCADHRQNASDCGDLAPAQPLGFPAQLWKTMMG